MDFSVSGSGGAAAAVGVDCTSVELLTSHGKYILLLFVTFSKNSTSLLLKIL